jgi:hypothetical protein
MPMSRFVRPGTSTTSTPSIRMLPPFTRCSESRESARRAVVSAATSTGRATPRILPPVAPRLDSGEGLMSGVVLHETSMSSTVAL